jgi:hypothetical protein
MAHFSSSSVRKIRCNALLFTVLLAVMTIGAKPKPKPKDPPPPPPMELPADLNKASLRVHATDMLYELDLSTEQLKVLRAAADGTANDRDRSPAKGDPKLVAAFNDFFKALLARGNDEEIAKLRNHLTELATADEVHLDDDIEPTDAARAKAADAFKQMNAGQIAAYLAAHADQVCDPVERIVSELAELNAMENAGDVDTQIQQTSDDVGWLVAGQDKKAASAVAGQVTAWFRANRHMNDADLLANHATLETSAKKVVGDIPAMDILKHFLENETAELLSNPQLPQAIGAVLAAQESESK